MNYYKMQISLESGLGTPLAADTLFGHLCWSILYRDGEDSLNKFLASYKSENPAVVLSDPFPEGFLPMPFLPLTIGQRDKLRELIKAKSRKASNSTEANGIAKKLVKSCWVNKDVVFKDIKKLSAFGLFEQMIDTEPPKTFKQKLVAHNAINRFSGTVQEGSLFFTQEYFMDSGEAQIFDVYLYSDYDRDKLGELFRGCFELGYGKYKSRGKGAIKLISLEETEFPKVDNPNAAICLSPLVPDTSDPVDGFWQLNFKQGKLGGHWANGPTPGDENGEAYPFKYPLVMLKSGSVLFDKSPKPYYGRLVENIHPTATEVCHLGVSLALPIEIDMEEI